MTPIGPYVVEVREREDWRCECGDLNRAHEWCCYRCGAGAPDDAREREVVTFRWAFAALEEVAGRLRGEDFFDVAGDPRLSGALRAYHAHLERAKTEAEGWRLIVAGMRLLADAGAAPSPRGGAR